MKVNEVFTEIDARRYIKRSKSWEKAWLVSYRKWDVIDRYGEYKYNGCFCGFCFVSKNRNNDFMYCNKCPVKYACNDGYCNKPAQYYLKYLKKAKKRIFALK